MGRRGNSTAWRRSKGITRRLHYAPRSVQLQRVCAKEVQRPRANRVRPAFARPTPTRARGQGPQASAKRWDARARPGGAPGWRARHDRPGVCRARVRTGGAAREATKTWRRDSFGTGWGDPGGLARQCGALGRPAQERPGPPPAPATYGRGIRNGAGHRRPPRRGGGTELGREVDHGQGSWDGITLGSGPHATCRTVRGGSVVRCPTIAGASSAHALTPSCRPTPSPPGPHTPPWC